MGAQKHGQRRNWLLRIAVVVAVAAAGYLVFEFGRMQADYNIVDAAAERKAFEDRIEGLEKQVAKLKEEIALLETHREIDGSAYEKVEASLVGLQQKIQEQRAAIAFYRGIISPEDGGRGLRVQDLKVMKGKDEREYHVSLVLVQVMQHDRSVRGDVGFSLEGAQDGEAAKYTLEQLVPADEDSDWPFSFRYFQAFERNLILPDGFTPEKVNVEVRSRTKSIASVEQSFLWPAAEDGRS
jgi:septal ring factor EnvC (AmiA/AmiB activator)